MVWKINNNSNPATIPPMPCQSLGQSPFPFQMLLPKLLLKVITLGRNVLGNLGANKKSVSEKWNVGRYESSVVNELQESDFRALTTWTTLRQFSQKICRKQSKEFLPFQESSYLSSLHIFTLLEPWSKYWNLEVFNQKNKPTQTPNDRMRNPKGMHRWSSKAKVQWEPSIALLNVITVAIGVIVKRPHETTFFGMYQNKNHDLN